MSFYRLEETDFIIELSSEDIKGSSGHEKWEEIRVLAIRILRAEGRFKSGHMDVFSYPDHIVLSFGAYPNDEPVTLHRIDSAREILAMQIKSKPD